MLLLLLLLICFVVISSVVFVLQFLLLCFGIFITYFQLMLIPFSDVVQMLIVLISFPFISICLSVSLKTMAHTTAIGMSGIPLCPPASTLSRGSSKADLTLPRATTHAILFLMGWGFSGRGAFSKVGGTLQACTWLVGEIGFHSL